MKNMVKKVLYLTSALCISLAHFAGGGVTDNGGQDAFAKGPGGGGFVGAGGSGTSAGGSTSTGGGSTGSGGGSSSVNLSPLNDVTQQRINARRANKFDSDKRRSYGKDQDYRDKKDNYSVKELLDDIDPAAGNVSDDLYNSSEYGGSGQAFPVKIDNTGLAKSIKDLGIPVNPAGVPIGLGDSRAIYVEDAYD